MSVATFLVSRLLVVVFVVMALLRGLVIFIRHPTTFFKRTKRLTPPDCMLDPTLGKHEYVTANGLKFHYVTCGDPSKPLMLLLHGFPEFWYSWRHQLKVFSDDYHVVAVDLRGYGETQRPPNTLDYTLPHLRQDVVELIPALGHDKAILVAHDWGGAIAWVSAQEHPELVEKLIVLNCPHPTVMAKRVWHLSQLLKSWYAFFFQVPWLPEMMFRAGDYVNFNIVYRGREAGVRNKKAFTHEDVEAYKYTFSQDGAITPPLNYYRANVFRSMENASNKQISVPVLIIWGDDDIFFDTAVADSHEEVASDVTVRHIANCSHWVQNDNPERVNQYIKDFLA